MPKHELRYTQDLTRLFEKGRIKTYPKNQLIHYQGDPLSNIYLVRRGLLKAYTILDSGDTRTILILARNDLFPLVYTPSMDWKNYKIQYFYQSMTDLELATLPAGQFKNEIDSNPELMKSYASALAASNHAISAQLEIMKSKKAIDKLSLLLPYLINKMGSEMKVGYYQLKVKLSHQEIADLSGVTRETTTTLMKQLEKKGVIAQNHGKLRINAKILHRTAKK